MKKYLKQFLLNFLLCSVVFNFTNTAYPVLASFVVSLVLLFVPRREKQYGAGASFNLQNADVRENFRVAAHMIAEANGLFVMKNGKNVPDISRIDMTQLTQGYIITMCDIVANNSTLQFPIVDTQQISNAPVVSIMRLLSMQDSFVVGSLSYFLMSYVFSGGNEQNVDFTLGNYFTPLTYPSAFHNPGSTAILTSGGFGVMGSGMSLFWNAYISITVDKKVVIPYWDTQRHLYVPEQQATQLPFVTGTPTQWPMSQDQYDGSTDGYYPVEPTIVLGGGRQNDVRLNLPANVPATIAPLNSTTYGTGSGDNFILKACICFRGILAQNSTSVK